MLDENDSQLHKGAAKLVWRVTYRFRVLVVIAFVSLSYVLPTCIGNNGQGVSLFIAASSMVVLLIDNALMTQ
jgi:hypothetical protein